MIRTPLHDRLVAAGAQMTAQAEIELPAAFSDPDSEFRELRGGCALYDLGGRVKIAATGRDRVRWLNGMISNNIRDLAVGKGSYNFLLTPQGRVQGDLYAYNRGESILLDVEREQAPRLLELLKKYIIMDQVELTEVSDQLAALAVQGPKAAAVLGAAGFQVPPLDPLQVHDFQWRQAALSLVRMPAEVAEGYEIWGAPPSLPAVWDALLAAGATPVGSRALEMCRIAAGIPRYGVDIRDRELPQETGQVRALNFTKGCYIGQEIVERIRSRGAVHRGFTGFVVEGDPPAPGSKVLAEGKEVGEITSSTTVPAATGTRTLALGYLRSEASGPGAAVEIDGRKAVVARLPFEIA